MKIQICDKKYSKNGRKVRYKKLVLWFPLSFLKFKFIWKKVNNEDMHIDLETLRINFYKSIKDYVKENGHFNILEVESKGRKVVIRV